MLWAFALFGLMWLAWFSVIVCCAIRRAQLSQRTDRFNTAERDLALTLRRELTRALDDAGA